MPLARLRLGDACIANTTEKEYKLGDYGTDGKWGLASDWLWGPFHGMATTRHAIMQVLQGQQVTRPKSSMSYGNVSVMRNSVGCLSLA